MAVKCCICFELLFDGQEVGSGPCGHTFHSDCILKWVSDTHKCPVCRHKLRRCDVKTLYFDTTSTDNDTLLISASLQNELDSKNAELKAKDMELASVCKKVKDLQEHAATTEQLYHTMRQQYLSSQSELESYKLRLKESAKLETQVKNLKKENMNLENELMKFSNMKAILQGTQLEADEILREQSVSVAREVGISTAKNLANLCSILKRELFKLRAQKAEHKKREDELLYELGVKNAKLKRMQQYHESCVGYANSTPRPVVSYFANASTNITEDELAIQIPIATEGKHAKQMTPIADEKNIVSTSSSIKDGGNVEVTPIQYNFSEKRKPTLKKEVLDNPVTQSLSSLTPVNRFSKPLIPPFNKQFDSNNDSITRVGYNGLGGHERVIFARARDLPNTKPYKKNPNAKKRKQI